MTFESPPTLAAKVAHLRRPDAYPDVPRDVAAIETHMAWVFLAGELAYKLKKPVRYAFLDFSTPAARRHDCEEEVRLNRRLAPGIYLDVVTLTCSPGGRLTLAGEGEPVDFLVRMRRLPAHLMLDRALRDGTASAGAVERSIAALVAFYRGCAPEPMSPQAYLSRYREGIATNQAALLDPGFRLSVETVLATAAAQRRFLDRDAPLLEQRARNRRIVEGHGDLRPEHVCLSEPPVFIDCLEFRREWRLVDPADEIACLALECEQAQAPATGELAFSAYRRQSGDDIADTLVAFYKSWRAGVRARLSAAHLHDHPDAAARRKWRERARRYLGLAHRHAEAAAPAAG